MRLNCLCVFFFQAEDGIRDLVRSRGLGDVYKRQAGAIAGVLHRSSGVGVPVRNPLGAPVRRRVVRCAPVSYTHLTLPTSDLV